jgi:hypothetical protein
VQQIQRAWAALKTNHTAVAAYVGAATVLGVVYLLAHRLPMGDIDPENAPDWMKYYGLALSILHPVIYSVLQAVGFAFVGRTIDRPLWRCDTALEALKRFYITWLLLNLGLYLFMRLIGLASLWENADLFGFLSLLLAFYYALYIPVGGALMYASRLKQYTVGEALAPLGRRIGATLVVMLLMFVGYVVNLMLAVIQRDNLLIDVINHGAFSFLMAWIELVAFAAVWLLCMDDRAADMTDNNDPFDF